MSSSCVVLVCGLPATGKSKLVANFIHFLDSQNQEFYIDSKIDPRKVDLKKIAVINICYDELIPLESQEKIIKITDRWKKYRQEILEASEIYLRKLLGFPASDTLKESNFLQQIEKLNKNDLDVGVMKDFLLLVDDNFYYSSMRYSWYQMAKRLSVGYCQVFLLGPLEELKEHNERRAARIPIGVLETMARKEERPNPEKNPWEKHSLILESAKGHQDDSQMITISDLIQHAMANPEKPVQPIEKMGEKLVGTPNTINIIDRISRKLVSSKIEEAKGKGVKLPEYSRQMNSVRLKILENVKSGVIKIPSSFEEDYYDHKSFVLEVFRLEELSFNILV